MEKIISNAVAHLGIGTIKGSSNKNKISSAKEIFYNLKIQMLLELRPTDRGGPREKLKKV